MKVLVLAAGYATRLYPLTKDYPKPLLKVGNKPIVSYIIEKLEPIDEIDEIFLITNSKFFNYFKKWAAKLSTEKKITLIDDRTTGLNDRRGAIGDMIFAINKRHIKDDLLVIGGDNILDGSLDGFVTYAKKHRNFPVIGVYRLKEKKNASKYGVVSLDSKGKIVNFQEKPKRPKSSLVAMCLYYFPASKLNLIKEYLAIKAHKLDATGSYIDWMRNKISVYGYQFKGHWYDIGDYNYYNQAKKIFKTEVT